MPETGSYLGVIIKSLGKDDGMDQSDGRKVVGFWVHSVEPADVLLDCWQQGREQSSAWLLA